MIWALKWASHKGVWHDDDSPYIISTNDYMITTSSTFLFSLADLLVTLHLRLLPPKVSFVAASIASMETIIKITTTYRCSLERAFRTPMLCDIAKVHTGFGPMPKVTHCTDDENWGKPGFSKKVHAEKSWTQKGGFASTDTVIERIENSYWKIEVSNFQSWMLGFSRFVGEWKTTEIGHNLIAVEYTYTLHSDVGLLYPFNWLFAHTFWKIYMKRVLKNILNMISHNEPYLYK